MSQIRVSKPRVKLLTDHVRKDGILVSRFYIWHRLLKQGLGTTDIYNWLFPLEYKLMVMNEVKETFN